MTQKNTFKFTRTILRVSGENLRLVDIVKLRQSF